MAKDTQLLKCVILTLRKENVIVPNALVAEIISVKDIEETENSPGWFLKGAHHLRNHPPSNGWSTLQSTGAG